MFCVTTDLHFIAANCKLHEFKYVMLQGLAVYWFGSDMHLVLYICTWIAIAMQTELNPVQHRRLCTCVY